MSDPVARLNAGTRGPQLRTRKTVDSWVWLGGDEGIVAGWDTGVTGWVLRLGNMLFHMN